MALDEIGSDASKRVEPASPPRFSFSTDVLPERDRGAFFKEELAPLIALDVEPLGVEAMKVVHPERGCEAGVAKPTSPESEPRMNTHKNARMTVHGRALLVNRITVEGWRVADAAAAAGVLGADGVQMAGSLSCGRRADA